MNLLKNVPKHNLFHVNNQLRGNNGKITNSCNFTKRVLLIDDKGECLVCKCAMFLPVSVGNITDFDSLEEVWSNPIAKHLQQDIDDKKFTYCAVEKCGIASTNMIQDHYTLLLNVDESCNLACPSCRRSAVMHKSGDEFEKRLAQFNHFLRLLEKFDKPTQIIISGSGDPFASHITRPFLTDYKPLPNHKVHIFTNALLLKKQLRNNPLVDNINIYWVSIDAGSKETYEIVRRPGKWENLIENLDFLKELSEKTNAMVSLRFVLQNSNYKDLKSFGELCKKYNFNGHVAALENWTAWDNFSDHDVLGNMNHENHSEAILLLKDFFKEYFNFNITFDNYLRRLIYTIKD